MKSISVASIMVSMFYSLSSHPVLLMALILIQAVAVCLAGWVNLKISWFSYILFLIFLGGLMVLFIYIVSLASNEKILLHSLDSAPIMITTTLVAWWLMENLNIQQYSTPVTAQVSKYFNFMYSFNSMILTSATMVYLLLTLVIVVKISNKFEAPLKNTIFS